MRIMLIWPASSVGLGELVRAHLAARSLARTCSLAVASNNGSHVREVSLARTRLAIAVGEKSPFNSCTAQHKREPKPSISGQYSGLEGAAAGVELGRGCGEGCREICLPAPLHLRHAVVGCLTTPSPLHSKHVPWVFDDDVITPVVLHRGHARYFVVRRERHG